MFKTFFNLMMPRRQEVTPENIQKLENLKKLTDGTDADLTFVKFVDEGVDKMKRQVQIRELAATKPASFVEISDQDLLVYAASNPATVAEIET